MSVKTPGDIVIVNVDATTFTGAGVQVTALAPKASPTFTGTPAAPTAAPGTSTTQIATTAFVAAAVSGLTGVFTYKGATDCSANPNYPAGAVGDTYSIDVAGKIGGASGTDTNITDWYICIIANAGGTEASVGSKWGHITIPYRALLSGNNLSDVLSASTSRTNLGVPAGSGTSTGTNTGDKTGHFLRRPVKTANYTAFAGDLVPCDTTGGSFTVTLPNAPADQSVVCVKHIIQASTNSVSVACAGSDVFNKASGSTTATLSLLNQAIYLQYDSANAIWTVLADDISLAALDARFSPLAGSASIVTVGTLAAGSIPYSLVTGGPSAVSAANPTASIGLTAVNGSASTFMRSDGAPVIDLTAAFAFSNLGATTAKASSANAFTVGVNGTTNPVFNVVSNVASQATGLSVTGNAAGSGVTLTVLSSGTHEGLIVIPKGTTASAITLNAPTSYVGKLLDLQINSVQFAAVTSTGGGYFGAATATKSYFGNANGNQPSPPGNHASAIDGTTLYLGGQGGNAAIAYNIVTGSLLLKGGFGAGYVNTATDKFGAGVADGTAPTAQLQSNSSSASLLAGLFKAAASRTAALANYQTSAGGSLGNVSGGCIGDVFADVSTTSTNGTFDTLRTDTTVANALIVNGDKIEFDYTLTVVSHGTNTGEFKLTFAGINFFDSTALTFSATGTVRIFGYLTRKSSTTARASISTLVAGAGLANSTYYSSDSTLTGLTLTGTNNLVLTAAAAGGGAASADIVLTQAKISIKGFGS